MYNQKTDLDAISEFVTSNATIAGTTTGRMLKTRGKANLQMATTHLKAIRTKVNKKKQASPSTDLSIFTKREIATTLRSCTSNIKGVITSIALDYKNNRVFTTPVNNSTKPTLCTGFTHKAPIEFTQKAPTLSLFDMETPDHWEEWSDEDDTVVEPDVQPTVVETVVQPTKVLEKPTLKRSKVVQFSDKVIEIKPVSCWGPVIRPCTSSIAHMSVRDEIPTTNIKPHRSTYTKMDMEFQPVVRPRNTQPVVRPRNTQRAPPFNVKKTQPCRHMMRHGRCNRGNQCGFAHSKQELNPRICGFGDRCKKRHSCCDFFHPEQETKEQFITRMYPYLQ